MPIFEYRCYSCNHKFSVLTKVLSQPVTLACPVCAGTSLQKLISRFSVSRSEADILDDLSDAPSGCCPDGADEIGGMSDEGLREEAEGYMSELLSSDKDGLSGWEDRLAGD